MCSLCFVAGSTWPQKDERVVEAQRHPEDRRVALFRWDRVTENSPKYQFDSNVYIMYEGNHLYARIPNDYQIDSYIVELSVENRWNWNGTVYKNEAYVILSVY